MGDPPLSRPDRVAGQVIASLPWPDGVSLDARGNLFLGEVNNGQRYYKYSYKGLR